MASVKLSVPSALLFKDARREKLWSAIHALITNALHELEVDQEEEEGQVENTEQPPEQDMQVVEVTFWESYFEDPSGLWTDLLQREGLQSNLEYDLQNSSIVGMSEEEAQAFHNTVGFSASSSSARKSKACFNCGEVGHEVATCPLPIDKKRIASSKGGGRGAHARYHEPEKFAKFKLAYQPGQITDELKAALGVQEDPFVSIRKRLGEPPRHTMTTTEQNEEEEESEESEREEEEGALAEVDLSPVPPAPAPTPCKYDVPGELWSKRVLPLCTCPGDCPRAHGRYTYVPPVTATPSPQLIKRTRYENDEADVPPRTSSTTSSGDRGRRNRSRDGRYRRRSPSASYRQSYSPHPPNAYAPQYPTPPPPHHQQQQQAMYPLPHYQMQPYPMQQQVPYGAQYPSYPQPPPCPPSNNNNSASQRPRRPVSYDGY